MKNKFLWAMALSFVVSACSVASIEDRYLTKDVYNDVNDFTLQQGDNIPSIALADSQGAKHNLRTLAGEQNLLIVFYRGDWCPFCINQLESFEAVLPELDKHNTQLVAISPDSVATNKNTQRQFGQNYLFLSDENLTVIDMFGLKKDETTPHPATLLVKKGGEVVWYYVSKDYKTRPTGTQMKQVLTRYLK
ncbi:peroxiredoxin family protein [Catenovulum sediminis]|uniref:thioredoxin-dependent peroxiredoxin n=1 Tax=Catenovulum sediminis TaxID=1740262 RepID=A0ABV1RNG1_9ALTE